MRLTSVVTLVGHFEGLEDDGVRVEFPDCFGGWEELGHVQLFV
jgi:hypothetical protein